MTNSAFHIQAGSRSYHRSDTCMSEFAYHCAKVVRTNFLDAGTGEAKEGAKYMAEYANLSSDTVENYALAFRLFVAFVQYGHMLVETSVREEGRKAAEALIAQVKLYWRTLYKTHWVIVAKDWRKHQDLEIAINDLETFAAHGMNEHEAGESKRRPLSFGEMAHRHQAIMDRAMEDFISEADKDRYLLRFVGTLKKVYEEQYKPALLRLQKEIHEHKERQESIETQVVQLGFGEERYR